MITVACVWVRGNVPYGFEYVRALRRGVALALDRPFRFVCLTDRPNVVESSGLPIEAARVASPAPMAGWWAKVGLFDPFLETTEGRPALAGRVLYLDLDVLVVGALDELVAFPAPFVLCPPGGTFAGRDGLRTVRRYNSSVMAWDAGAPGLGSLFLRWSPAEASRLWGDQDWIGERYPDAATFPPAWVPRFSDLPVSTSSTAPAWGDARVVLVKKPKPIEAARRFPWFAEAWRG